MVRELQRITQTTQFPETAPAANPVFFRTYSRRIGGGRETWEQVCDRTLGGLVELGKLTPAEAAILEKTQKEMKSLPSGRWLWVGGTEWISRPENFSGAYNCTSTNVVDWRAFGLMMDLAMMGCGTGAILEPQYINQLPVIRNRLHVTVEGEIGTAPAVERQDETEVQIEGNIVNILVGDSRRGWVKSYQTLLELSSNEHFSDIVHVSVNLNNIRPAGEILKGFGGVANPIKLPELYQRCAAILNKAVGRKLNSVECCLLIDEAAVVVVAGNVRRCLPEDALVHTSTGLVPIRDIQIGDLVQTPLGFRQVVDKFDQGVQEVYEIETNGTFPRATLNHRIAVLADAKGNINWKQVGDIVEGDRLMHNTQVLPGTVTHLPPDFTAERPIQKQADAGVPPALKLRSRNAQPIIIPELTPEVAWLIGLTHGDGYVSLGRNKHGKPYGAISWACSSLDRELATKIHHKIDRALALFGLKATHVLLSNENTLRSRVTSIRLAEYFREHIKQPNKAIEIPDFILQGSVDIRAAYLAGLMDSDGAINNRPPHLVTTVYRSFARQVAAVLSSLGIAGRVKLTRPQVENWQVKYNVTLPALKNQYNALIALHSAKGELRQGLKMYGFTIPGEMMREVYTYSEMREMGFQGSRSVDSNYERYTAESDVCLDIPVTVQSLGSYDYVQTYDIEVEEAHCFYCDGYLTHNSAGMRQGTSNDELFANAKTNLWQQDENGNWRIDPERDALRMANHTRVFHQKPTLEECINAVRNQYYSGEGAIQYAPEAIARSNADLLTSQELKQEFIKNYTNSKETAHNWLRDRHPEMTISELEHRLSRYGLNPCGEILGGNFHCNLSEVHLNQIDPKNDREQEEAFTAGALSVASLLNHKFLEPRYQLSRELDPIVGVSFTGLFDFFVRAFGVDWLRWWEQGRPEEFKIQNSKFKIEDLAEYFRNKEREYLSRWCEIVFRVVWEYCDRHNIKRPNRCTTVQPSGTKSLLTGASPGWHPPKAQRFIRRITFRKNDPVALACIDYGYSVVPSQSDKDENGNLLNDPFDPRCMEWLVEIPVAVPWANLPGADEIEISKFSALAQMDFYMQVQKYYVTHNTSATIELRENEVEALGTRIYETIQNNEGYISAALLARFDDLQTFPRLPFEPITKAKYEELMQQVHSRRQVHDFYAALSRYDARESEEAGPAGCDSDKCLFPQEGGKG